MEQERQTVVEDGMKAIGAQIESFNPITTLGI